MHVSKTSKFQNTENVGSAGYGANPLFPTNIERTVCKLHTCGTGIICSKVLADRMLKKTPNPFQIASFTSRQTITYMMFVFLKKKYCIRNKTIWRSSVMNYIVQRLQWSKIINLSRGTFPFNHNQLIANRL